MVSRGEHVFIVLLALCQVMQTRDAMYRHESVL